VTDTITPDAADPTLAVREDAADANDESIVSAWVPAMTADEEAEATALAIELPTAAVSEEAWDAIDDGILFVEEAATPEAVVELESGGGHKPVQVCPTRQQQ